MVKVYYEVDIKFKETGTGHAEIVVPRVLSKREWHFVQVHGGEPKAIVLVNAGTSEHTTIAKAAACRRITKKKMIELKKTYPTPKLKQRIKRLEPKETDVEEISEPILETVQTVRWRFFIIELPIQDN